MNTEGTGAFYRDILYNVHFVTVCMRGINS